VEPPVVRRTEAERVVEPPVVPRTEAGRIVRPVAAQPVVWCPARTEAARPDVPAGLCREHLQAQHPARPSAAAARKVRVLQATEEAEAMVAQRLARAEGLAPPALQAAVGAAVREAQQVQGVVAAQPQVASEVWDVVAAPRPAAESAGVARRLEGAAVQGVAAVQRRAAGPASVVVRLRGAAGAQVQDAGVLLRGARDAQGVLLLAAAWAAGLLSTRLQGGRLVPSARARSAHARGCSRTARP
jgi:hypothetical protein